MKKKIIQFLCILPSLLSCMDDSEINQQDSAILLGYDMRLFPCTVSSPCSCPGGILVEIHGTTYRSIQYPNNSTAIFDGTKPFPINVNLNWEKSKSCPLDLIDITEMTLR